MYINVYKLISTIIHFSIYIFLKKKTDSENNIQQYSRGSCVSSDERLISDIPRRCLTHQ